mgnify:CR=1 FL=1|jgi:hypothetical protein
MDATTVLRNIATARSCDVPPVIQPPQVKPTTPDECPPFPNAR